MKSKPRKPPRVARRQHLKYFPPSLSTKFQIIERRRRGSERFINPTHRFVPYVALISLFSSPNSNVKNLIIVVPLQLPLLEASHFVLMQTVANNNMVELTLGRRHKFNPYFQVQWYSVPSRNPFRLVVCSPSYSLVIIFALLG